MRAYFIILLLWALTSVIGLAAPVAVDLPFDEGHGAVTHDQAGRGLMAALRGGAAWVPGVHGTAVGLKEGQSVELDRAAVKTRAGFSVSAWVKVDKLGGTQTFVSQDGQAVSGFRLQLRGDDARFAFSLPEADRATAPLRTVQSDFTPTPGLWYHLTGVFDKTAGQIRLYADGTPLAATTFTSSWNATGHTEIGRDLQAGQPGDFVTGAVDEVRLYPRALTDAQVAALHQADLKRFQPNTFPWANPIYFQGNGRGADIHDPDILQDDGVYYLVYTMAPFRNFTDRDPKLPDMGSAPGIALYASRDLKVWKFKNWILKSSDLPDDCPYKHQFWAPELHKISGRYYVIFGGSNWLDDRYNVGGHMGYYQFVGVADTVAGPYRHFTALKGPGVDTSLFQDDDGKTYAVWPGNEIHPIDLTRIGQNQITVGPTVGRAAGPADFKAIGQPVPETMEGPYLIKRAGTYYCFFAETYRGPLGFYDTAVSMSRNLAGPWRLDPRWRVFPGGHQALFTGPDGRFWTSYKHEGGGETQPWLNIDPVEFRPDGTVQVTPTKGPQSVALKH